MAERALRAWWRLLKRFFTFSRGFGHVGPAFSFYR
jgi:hypothetical protein